MRIGYRNAALVTIIISATTPAGASTEVIIGGEAVPYMGAAGEPAVQRAAIAEKLRGLLAEQRDTLDKNYGSERLLRLKLNDGTLDAFLWEVEYRPGTDEFVCRVEPFIFEGADKVFTEDGHPGIQFVEDVTMWPIEKVAIAPRELCAFTWTRHENVWSKGDHNPRN